MAADYPQEENLELTDMDKAQKTTNLAQKKNVIETSASSLQASVPQRPQINMTQFNAVLRRTLDDYDSEKKSKIRLPEFWGDPEKWHLFKCEVERIRKVFSPSQLMTALQEALKGNARKEVCHLFENPNNVLRILKILEENFDETNLVVRTLANEAKQAPNPDPKNPSTIVAFSAAVKALVTNIESFKKMSYLVTVDFVDELIQKLPANSLRKDWYNWLQWNSSRQCNLQEFSVWLDRKMHKLVKSPKRRCNCCRKYGHLIEICRNFAKKNRSEKMTMLMERGLCYNCLNFGHKAFQCRKRSNCGVEGCTIRHHALIHQSA